MPLRSDFSFVSQKIEISHDIKMLRGDAQRCVYPGLRMLDSISDFCG